MQLYRTSLYFFRISLDIIILIGSFILTAYVTVWQFDFLKNVNAQFLILALAIIWFFSSKSLGLYDEFRSRNFSYEIIILLKSYVIQVISTVVILYLLKDDDMPRYFILVFASTGIVWISTEKFIFRKILNRIRAKGRNARNLLIVGAGNVGNEFYDTIRKNPHFGYKIIGFLDDRKKDFLNGQYLGKINDLDKVLDKQQVDNVIIALPNSATSRIEDTVRICEKHTTRVKIIPDYFKFVSSKYNITMFGHFPIISVREDRLNEFHWRVLKRTFDIIFTVFLYVFVFSWLWPLISVLIKISSSGPVLFKQERWGRNNKKFITYKFRSMSNDSLDVDNQGNYRQAQKDDPRITKIGKILRKTNLDELPQFWNVLKGDMSIVGPRPHPTPLNLESKEKIRLYMLRHLVKPGITGWAQINGFRGGTEAPELMQKRIDNDLWYIENWSFWLDIQIIFLTAWNMLRGDPNAY